MAGYKQESRRDWGSGNREPSIEELQLGALCRIADAIENMQQPYTRLLERVKYLEGRVEYLNKENAVMVRSNRGLRAFIKSKRKK